jgi:hypothetical protein
MKGTKPVTETPPLTRAGRKLAEATLAAAKFRPTVDGKRMVRDYVVHGMKVTEWVSAEDAGKQGNLSGITRLLSARN